MIDSRSDISTHNRITCMTISTCIIHHYHHSCTIRRVPSHLYHHTPVPIDLYFSDLYHHTSVPSHQYLDGSNAKFFGGLQVHSEIIKKHCFIGFHIQRTQRVFIDTSLWLTHLNTPRLYHLHTHTHTFSFHKC